MLIYTPLAICPRVVWQGHRVGLILVLLGTSLLTSIVVALVYIPRNSVRGFLFPISVTAFIVVCIIDDSYSGDEMESQCSFDLHFLCGQGW
jgi:cadmium resistance protein CadD (predicted permease)